MAGNNIHSQITAAAEIHVPKGFTEASNNTAVIKNAAGALEWRSLDALGDEKSNFFAVVDPTVTDDSSLGYAVGSRWCNTVLHTMFECVNASPGAANWVPLLKSNPGSVSIPSITDDASKGYREGSFWVQLSTPTNIGFVCIDSSVGNAQWSAINTPIVVGIDHRTLSHVTAPADDHTQYVHIDGRRGMTGDLDLGNNDINNVTNVFGEQRLLTTNLVRVKKNPGFGEFSSVAAAVASITTASFSNPFLVQVGPGVYIEPQIVMKPYVFVDGLDSESAVIEAADPTDHLIIGADNSALSGMVLTGVTSPGKALIYYASTTGTVQTTFWAENVRFGSSDTLAIADGTFSFSNLFIVGSRFGGVYQFNTGFVSRTSGATYGRITVRNSTSTKMTSPYPVDMFVADGVGCEMNLKSVTARTGVVAGGGNGLRIRNGGSSRIASADIDGFSKGMWVENVGPDPFLIGGIMIFLNNTTDVQIDHPGVTGGLACGANDDTKVIINPSATSLGFVIMGLEDGDIVVSGKEKQNQPDGTFTDITTLQKNAAPMGLLSTGDIDFPVGTTRTTTVEAGQGYLQKTDGSLRKITWNATNFTAPANQVSFLYFDSSGTLQINGVMPDSIQNIVVGRVVTDSSKFIVIEESGFQATHAASNIGQALRNGLGVVYSSGSNVSEIGTRTLGVTAGSYYYGERNFLTVGGSPITFTQVYQNGSGGYTLVDGQTVVSNSQYDNGSGTLASITASDYAKHSLYALGDSTGDSDSEKYFLVMSQAQYTSLTLAEQGSLPTPPNYFDEAVTLIASVIVQQGVTNIVEIRDERPLFASKRSSSVAAASFHHNLLGLNDFDDHLRYLPVDGSRAMTADLPMGTHNVTNAGTYNGVTVENHHARHQPGSGTDELPTAAAITQTPNQANATGSSTSLSRADHVHNIPTATASGLNTTSTNTQGSASSFSQSDHTHAIASGAPVTQNPDQVNAAGSSVNFAKADHIHTIPTTVAATQTPDQTNATGVSTSFSRADHVHNIPTATASGLNANSTNTQGSAASFGRSDHTHAIASGTPSAQTPDQTNATGTSTNFARADHIHNIPTAAASTLNANSTNTQGAAASFARSDHTHAVSSGVVSTQTPDQTNAAGTSANFARADHVHNIPTATVSDTGTANAQGSAASFARSDHTHNTVISHNSAASQSSTTTASPSDAAISGMTITPVAGTYLVFFEGVFSHSTNNALTTFSIYTGITQDTNSQRQFKTQNNAQYACQTTSEVTVNGSTAITAQWNTSAATATIVGRSLRVFRVGS